VRDRRRFHDRHRFHDRYRVELVQRVLDILGGIIPLGNTEEYRKEVLKSAGVTVGEVMTDDLVTVSPEATLAETATVMAERRKKMLPVVEGERLAGVITRMDILTLHVLNPRL